MSHEKSQSKSTLRKWYEELENEYLTKMLEKQMNANSDYAQDLYSLDFSSAGEYFSRNTRGINEECCHKPCTTKTLKLYCRSS
ncbi:hypothetical protein B4U79_18087 [Dinothrombium tinctorium]|uniref:Insulin-like domain-containing protein n=1 Tax=Dinothrombium tinctorium TaxID=1965070 RepID=A0A443R4Q2_9ACAR|nr:hypothetical protein B4U79_18129 [Dinothrombium tinctorium]RWS10253.1 hypothetical protein B4U79_18087 [Dinothrombium tinctorium]